MSSTAVFAPDGSVRMIPQAQLSSALNSGGEAAVQMKDPQGALRYVRQSQVSSAQQAGGSLVQSSPSDALLQKYGLPSGTDLSKPYFSQDQNLKIDPGAFSQAYAEAHPQQPAPQGFFSNLIGEAKNIYHSLTEPDEPVPGVEATEQRGANLLNARQNPVAAIPFFGPTISARAQQAKTDPAGAAGATVTDAAAAALPFLIDKAPEIGDAVSDFPQTMANALLNPETGRLKPGVRTASRVFGATAGGLTGMIGGHEYGPIGGAIVGGKYAPDLLEMITPNLSDETLMQGRVARGVRNAQIRQQVKAQTTPPEPELGSPDNPGWVVKLPNTMPEQDAQAAELGSPDNPGPFSKLPNRLTRAQIDALSEQQTSTVPKSTVPGVNVIPEPRSPFDEEVPNYMASIPRDQLSQLAKAGKPGAGKQLQQLGKTVIYAPPSGYDSDLQARIAQANGPTQVGTKAGQIAQVGKDRYAWNGSQWIWFGRNSGE